MLIAEVLQQLLLLGHHQRQFPGVYQLQTLWSTCMSLMLIGLIG